jgi:hypothetical protein
MRIVLSQGLTRDNLENDFMEEFSGRECHIMTQPCGSFRLICRGRGSQLATDLSTSAVCLLRRSRVEIVLFATERAGTRKRPLAAQI